MSVVDFYDVVNFYDAMSPFYHLIFPRGWETSIARHAQALDAIIRERWGEEVRRILDVSCGIGTQALGLASLGYKLTASDLSPMAVQRAKREAAQRGLEVDLTVADMRQAFAAHGGPFDVVLSADNAVPHLLNDGEILRAFRAFFQCCRPGGGCLLSVRDYEQEELTGNQVLSYGLRVEGGVRHLIFQLREFEPPVAGHLAQEAPHYNVSMYFVRDDGASEPATHVMRTRYYAIGIPKLMGLLRQAGFEGVDRLDGAFFQPVLVGTRPMVHW